LLRSLKVELSDQVTRGGVVPQVPGQNGVDNHDADQDQNEIGTAGVGAADDRRAGVDRDDPGAVVGGHADRRRSLAVGAFADATMISRGRNCSIAADFRPPYDVLARAPLDPKADRR
jgi:hypothetical protein